MSTEMAHYVVTAHPPGAVQCVAKGNFLSHNSHSGGDAQQVVAIAKSRRLEFRACTDGETPFPLLVSVTIHGRITNMVPLPLRTATTATTTGSTFGTNQPPSLLFVMTQDFQYAVLGSTADSTMVTTPFTSTSTSSTTTRTSSSGPTIQTIDSGKIRPTLLGHKPMDGAPIIALSTYDVHHQQQQNRTCLAMHLYDGFLTILPIHTHNYRRNNNKTGEAGAAGKSDNWIHSTTTTATTVPSTGGSNSSRSVLGSPLLGEPFHLRLEEHNIMDLVFLHPNPTTPPAQQQHQLAILHQDSRGLQHVVVYSLDVKARQLSLLWKKQRLDGGSSTLIAVPHISTVAAAAASVTASESHSSTASQTVMGGGGSLVVLGQRQITLLGLSTATTQVVPLPTCLILSYCQLPPSAAAGHARYLLGDEFGNLHMLTVGPQSLALDTLGSTTVLTSSMVYMDPGWVFCGSKLGDSQLLQIHPEPITQDCDDDHNNINNNNNHNNSTGSSSYLSVLEEYTNLGPIVDIDVCGNQSSSSSSSSSSPGGVVTASGTSMSGTLRLVRNGIGMKEFAAVELPGIQNMWAIRARWADQHDSYLVQAYVAETRILGVVSSGNDDGEAGNVSGDVTLDEVVLAGLDSTAASLYVGNVQEGDFVLQITATEIRVLRAAENFSCAHTWTPDEGGTIAVASANEAGQIVIALRGGRLVYLQAVSSGSLKVIGKTQMSSEVSCLNLNPFATSISRETDSRIDAESSAIFTVGLWDDLTVRLVTLDETMTEVLQIHLSTEDDVDSTETDGGLASQVRRNRNNMMARSLCLVTLDSTSSNDSDGGVDMLFVGLGDGTLISFVVDQQDGTVAVRSKKEVSLGTQRITLIPLQTERGGTCVLATGDRPTVIYLAGGGSRNLTPKLCYSNVNLSNNEADDEGAMPPTESITVNVATPFVSPQLFDDSSLSSKHYSLCVSDDSVLRLGVIDDIQKLHVTTCRLGMAPRRVVHCPEGRLFAVGCIESGIQQLGTVSDDVSMGNCIRFLDDTTFDDIERIDLEPHEVILSIASLQLATSFSTPSETSSNNGGPSTSTPTKPYLLIGTAYALPDEDEPTRGRVLLLSCADDDGNSTRTVKNVAEMHVRGGVYSICQFYDGLVLLTVNSKTHVCQLTYDGGHRLSFLGVGHHGHILSLLVQSRAPRHVTSHEDKSGSDDSSPVKKKPAKPVKTEQLAIVGDLMRSISLVQYYPEHKALEEVARDFNGNWTTAMEMLTDNLYLGAENWSNLFVLRRNAKATSDEIRCRLETVGRFHLGEMCNKFVSGSLTMPQTQTSNSGSSTVTASTRRKGSASPAKGATEKTSMRIRRPVVTVGSQTLFGTVDGTLGSILGLDARTAAFFTTLERAMAKTIQPIGDFSHKEFRAFDAENRVHPAHGFVDGDLIESFLDLDRVTMQAVVDAMNHDGGWEIENHNKQKDEEDESSMSVDNQHVLNVDDVLAMVEEMTMFH